MYGNVPPTRAADALPMQLGIFGEVEVQQHRLAVVGQQDVGGLQVPVDDAPPVRVGQPVGQPHGQPEDRLDIGQALRRGAGSEGPDAPGSVGGHPHVAHPLSCPGLDPVQQVLPRVRQRRPASQIREDVGERGRAEERHADGLEGVRLMDRVDRHDVGVLQLGERPRFVEEVRGDLQDHEAVGQLALPGQVDAAEGARPSSASRRKPRNSPPTRGIVVTAWARRSATTGSERCSSSKTAACSALPSKPSRDGWPAAPS